MYSNTSKLTCLVQMNTIMCEDIKLMSNNKSRIL